MKKQGNVEDISFVRPMVREFPRKGYRELYVLEDTWGAGVFLLIGASLEQVHQWSQERFNCKDPTAEKHLHAYAGTIEYNRCRYQFIVLREKWTWHRQHWVTLVHELHHVTTNILNNKGLTHGPATEEAWAYLQDSLLGRFIWALGNRRKIIDRGKPVKKRPVAKKPRKK